MLQSYRLQYRFSPEPPNSSWVTAIIIIDEGPRCYLDQVRFTGNTAFVAERLRQEIGFSQSTLYTPRLHRELELRLRDFYRQHGYARVEVTPVVGKSKTISSSRRQSRYVVLQIQEGSIHRIGTIRIQGNELTRADLIRRQLDIASGDVYNLAKIRSSEISLRDTRLFLWEEISEQQAGPKQIDLTVSVKERNSKIFTFMVGYDTSYGLIGGMEFEHINLWGTGRKLLFEAESSIFGGELFKSQGYSETGRTTTIGQSQLVEFYCRADWL